MSSAALPSFESRPWNVLVIGSTSLGKVNRLNMAIRSLSGIIRDACIPDPVLSDAEARRLRGRSGVASITFGGNSNRARGRRPTRSFNRVKERPSDQEWEYIIVSSIDPEAARSQVGPKWRLGVPETSDNHRAHVRFARVHRPDDGSVLSCDAPDGVGLDDFLLLMLRFRRDEITGPGSVLRREASPCPRYLLSTKPGRAERVESRIRCPWSSCSSTTARGDLP